MSVLEFENTQGITLRYSTASVFERTASYVIDAFLLGFVLAILAAVFHKLPGPTLFGMILAPVFFFYTLLMEMFNDGQSLGKMVLGLKVVRVDGKPPTSYDFFMRWIFRWLDIYMSSGAFAALLVSATPSAQRVGDLLADTTVIRKRNLRVPLKKILSLKTLKEYKPKYLEAGELSESQVILAKETLQRWKKFGNKAHEEAVKNLASRISQYLKIKQEGDAMVFIQTIIKDYIALTR